VQFGGITDLAFTADGYYLVLSADESSQGAEIWVRHSRTGALIRQYGLPDNQLYNPSDDTVHIATSPDRRSIAALSLTGNLYLLDFATGAQMWQADTRFHYLNVEFIQAKSQSQLVATTLDGYMVWIDADTGQEIRRSYRGVAIPVQFLGVSGDRSRLVVGETIPGTTDMSSSVSVYNSETGEVIRNFFVPFLTLNAVAIDYSGARIALAMSDGRTHIYDVNTAELKTVIWTEATGIQVLRFHPRLPYLAIGSEGGTQLWHTNAGELLYDFVGQLNITSLAFSPDGRRLAAGDERGAVMMWQLLPSIYDLAWWMERNRSIIEPTCSERIQYGYLPYCNPEGTYVPRIPFLSPTAAVPYQIYPTGTPIATPTPSATPTQNPTFSP
jgi:WD40 repeat protein